MYKQECRTSYENVCSGEGYHKKCSSVPRQQCNQARFTRLMEESSQNWGLSFNRAYWFYFELSEMQRKFPFSV